MPTHHCPQPGRNHRANWRVEGKAAICIFLAGLIALLVPYAQAGPQGYAVATVPAALKPPACLQPGMDMRNTIVRVIAGANAHGSGVVIGDNLVLTAAHVIMPNEPVRIALEHSEYQNARLVAIDKYRDLALLATPTGEVRPVLVAEHGLGDFEDVWAMGYPLALDMAITQGRYQRHANGKLYTSAWITSGASGGGLLRCTQGEYELAGMLRDYVAYVRDGQYVNASQSTSTPATSIREFAAQHGYYLPGAQLASTYQPGEAVDIPHRGLSAPGR